LEVSLVKQGQHMLFIIQRLILRHNSRYSFLSVLVPSARAVFKEEPLYFTPNATCVMTSMDEECGRVQSASRWSVGLYWTNWRSDSLFPWFIAGSR